MTKFDDCNEAVNLLNNVKGSIENKIRTVYNLGYKQGLEDGKIEAVRNVYTWVFKEQAEQTEPNCSEKPNNCKTEPTGYNLTPVEDEPQKWTKENCKGCKYNESPYDSGTCFVRVCINGNKYEPKE